MKKKIASIVAVIAAALVMVPAMVFAADSDGSKIVYLDGTNTESGDGTEASPYNNFKDAMTAVEDGGTIKLLGNYDKNYATFDEFENIRVKITKNITLDLNQHEINMTNTSKQSTGDGVSVNSGVKATVQNGSISSNKPSSVSGTVLVNSGAETKLIDCTVKGGENKSVVNLNMNSNFYAEGTTFVSASGSPNCITGEAKKVHMNDCTINASDDGISVASSDMAFEDCNVNTVKGADAYFLTIENNSEAVISGGEINGNTNINWASEGTLRIEGDIVVDGQLKLGPNNANSYMNIAGGKYVLEENLINSTRKEQITVSGGLFKNDTVVADFVKSPYKIIPNTGADSAEYPYTIQNIPEGTVACVGDKTFDSLEEAIAAAGEETILLIADVEVDSLSGNINGSGKTITYDGTLEELADCGVTLTNANVKCSNAEISNIALAGGRLTGGVVNGGDVKEFLAENHFVSHDTKKIADVSAFEATIGKTGYTYLINATTVAARTPEKETIALQKDEEGVHDEVIPGANYVLDLNGHTMGGFMIVPQTGGANLSPDNADITITDSSADKTGKIISEDNFAVATNGTLENIKLTLDGITVESKAAAGIYFPSSGILTIKDSNITGISGVELRGGSLVVENSNITATASEFKENANNSGSTVEGAAIVISQHATNHDIDVVIKSGTFKGIKAFYETDLQDEKHTNIKLELASGTFDGEVGSKNVKDFIKGGIFTKEIDETLIADGFLGIQKDKFWYVGEDAQKIIADSKPGDKIIVIHSPDKNILVPEGVIVENKTGDKISINDKIVENGETVTVPKSEKPSVPGGDGEQTDEGTSNSEGSITDGAAKTGDGSHPALLFAVAAAALCAGVAIFATRKKRN